MYADSLSPNIPVSKAGMVLFLLSPCQLNQHRLKQAAYEDVVLIEAHHNDEVALSIAILF